MKCNLQSDPAAPGAVWILVAAQNGSSTFLAQGVSLMGEFFWSTYCGSVLPSRKSLQGVSLTDFYVWDISCLTQLLHNQVFLFLSHLNQLDKGIQYSECKDKKCSNIIKDLPYMKYYIQLFEKITVFQESTLWSLSSEMEKMCPGSW